MGNMHRHHGIKLLGSHCGVIHEPGQSFRPGQWLNGNSRKAGAPSGKLRAWSPVLPLVR